MRTAYIKNWEETLICFPRLKGFYYLPKSVINVKESIEMKPIYLMINIIISIYDLN